MKGFTAFILLALLYSLQSHANPAWDYSASIQKEITPLKMDRFNQTAEHIWLALPSYLERWGILNTEAAATYNGILNTIVLKNDSMSYDEFGNFRLPKVSELKSRFNHSYSVPLSTIFHEMAHAQFDVFVEQETEVSDAHVMQVLKQQIYPWLKRNYPDKTFITLKTALSEIFAYYYGDLLLLISEDVNDIISANGYDMQNQRCLNLKSLQNYKTQLPPDEFVKILPLSGDLDRTYHDRLQLNIIWVRGKELELKTKRTDDPFQQIWLKSLWYHFSTFYSPPRTKRDLVNRLNTMPYWSSRIRACRDNILKVH